MEKSALQRGEGPIAVLISLASVAIAVAALFHSMKTQEVIATRTEIHSFDAKWVGGTFQCAKYLLGLPEEQKVRAFKGKAHAAPEGNRSVLADCVPEYSDEIEGAGGATAHFDVGSKYAYEAKEAVRRSFNALDIFVENFSEIDECKAWGTVSEIFKKDQTLEIVKQWRKYGNCGPNCFSSVGTAFDLGLPVELNRRCS